MYSFKIPSSKQLLHALEFFRLVRKRSTVPSLKPLRSAVADRSNGVLHTGHSWDIAFFVGAQKLNIGLVMNVAFLVPDQLQVGRFVKLRVW